MLAELTNQWGLIAMSDGVQIAIISGLATAVPVIIGQWLNSRKAARDIAEIKPVVLQAARTVEKIEIQGNSNSENTLRIGMISAQALAAQTGKSEHHVLAEAAESKFRTHMAGQAKIDSLKIVSNGKS